ncbi:MAG TPA: FAD-binding oxidoreductase [Thermoleophilaceae bacterium]
MNPPTATSHPATGVDELRARIAGDYVTPADPNWDEARLAWNLAVDQRPAAVALPETAEDVAEVVRYARDNGLKMAPQSTGHNAHPLELAQTVLVKTERLRSVEIDPEARIAIIGGGAIWQDVTHPAAEHGLAALAGSSPDVGVLGYSLGGGLSWLARSKGLAANMIEAIEIVTADGEIVRADADNEPDLYWAVRGGGGNFGVVTAIEMDLIPLTEVHAGVLFFPIERAHEVLHAWREWVKNVPDEVTSVGRLLRFPPLEEIPEPVRGGKFAVIEATMLVDEAEAADLLAPLRALGPAMDTFATIPVTELQHLHMDPPHPVPGKGDGLLLRDLPAKALDSLLEVTGPGVESPLLSVEIRHIGGAAGRPDPNGGALDSIDAPFVMFAVGMTPVPEMVEAVEAHVNIAKRALGAWDRGLMYLNFAEHKIDPSRLWSPAAYLRLRKIRAAYDPDELFRANHPVPPFPVAAE